MDNFIIQGCHKEINAKLAVVVITMEGIMITTTYYLMTEIPMMTVRTSLPMIEATKTNPCMMRLQLQFAICLSQKA